MGILADLLDLTGLGMFFVANIAMRRDEPRSLMLWHQLTPWGTAVAVLGLLLAGGPSVYSLVTR